MSDFPEYKTLLNPNCFSTWSEYKAQMFEVKIGFHFYKDQIVKLFLLEKAYERQNRTIVFFRRELKKSYFVSIT